MMTYQDAAKNLIELYASYVMVCTANNESFDTYNETLVIAIESLLIRADQEKQKAMYQQAVSHMSGIATLTPLHSDAQMMIDNTMDDLRGI